MGPVRAGERAERTCLGLGLSKRVREMVLAEGDGASELAKGDGASEDSDDVPISVRMKAKPTGAGDAAAPRKLRKAAA